MKKLTTIALCLLILCIFSGCKKNDYSLSTYEKTDQEEISISVVQDSVTQNRLTLEITNLTKDKLIVKSPPDFYLEKQIDGKWYKKKERYYLLDSSGQKPNSTVRRNVYFQEALSQGRYRLIKEYRGSEETKVFLDAEFEVKG